jgi:hypothetical protein
MKFPDRKKDWNFRVLQKNIIDQLARMGSEHLFIGPEPACGISIGVAKNAVTDWTNRNHKKNTGKP